MRYTDTSEFALTTMAKGLETFAPSVSTVKLRTSTSSPSAMKLQASARRHGGGAARELLRDGRPTDKSVWLTNSQLIDYDPPPR